MFFSKIRPLLISVEWSNISQVLYYWDYYNKPGKLQLQKAKTDYLVAIRIELNNADIASFVWALTERLGVKLYDANTMQALTFDQL